MVHGASKQGKTCLRKHHLSENDCIVLQCTRDLAKAALYEQLLKRAGVKCEVSNQTTLAGKRKLHVEVNVEGGVPLVTKAQGSGGLETEQGERTEQVTRDFDIDPSDANDVVRVMKAVGFIKFVVVEDFHYLDEEVQQAIAFDLKLFHDTSDLIFVIVGVWLESNRLTLYNGDLSGRVATVNADEWTDEQLAQVVTDGAALLNVRISHGVRNRIVSGCKSNVGLLQEVCYRLCERHEIYATQGASVDIESEPDVDEVLRAVADEQAARYRNFLARFAEGLGQTQLEMYKWIGFAVVNSSTEELRRGIKPNLLFHRIREEHPSADRLQRNNVDQALVRVGKVQFEHKLQPLIFDYSNGTLVVVDANFLVFMETHTRDELLEYLGF